MALSSPPDRSYAYPPRRRMSFRGIGIVAALGAVAVAVILLANALGGLFHVSLFGTTKIDRSAPVVLKQLRDVSKYTAATGEFQATVDVEDDVNYVPSFLAGERTIFVGVGTVAATVDFSRLPNDAVVVGEDGTVTITLPKPGLGSAAVDPARSHVANRDRGLVNRISGAFTDNPTSERELYLRAQERIQAAARKSELRVRAERNTETFLRGLLGKLGFERVSVVFADGPSTPSEL
jgi:Protein of unknown function (DUF4230)